LRRLALSAALLVTFAVPAAALAHVTVLPAFLSDGDRSTLTFSAPNERAPHAVDELVVTAPPGVVLHAVSPPPGWSMDVAESTVTWRGGRIGPGEIGEFRVAASTELEPGNVAFRAVQRYDDGATVNWTIEFTVLPARNAPKEHLWPALLAGVIGFVVIVGGLAFLRLRGGRRTSRTRG
jgi:uncharacterized protein YcnI